MMGDARSWSIFLVALTALAVYASALLVALVAGLVVFLKHRSTARTLPIEPPQRPIDGSKPLTNERSVYNLLSDTVLGINVRKSDNIFQAIFLLVSVMSLTAVGAVLASYNGTLPWYAGGLAGGFAGLVIGFFASGLLLMVYRGVRHLQARNG